MTPRYALNGTRPDKFILRRLSYNMSETETAAFVESKLQEHGAVESFETSSAHSASRMKALLRSKNASYARAAVERPSDVQVPRLGGAKLIINAIASIIFLILKELYEIT